MKTVCPKPHLRSSDTSLYAKTGKLPTVCLSELRALWYLQILEGLDLHAAGAAGVPLVELVVVLLPGDFNLERVRRDLLSKREHFARGNYIYGFVDNHPP